MKFAADDETAPVNKNVKFHTAMATNHSMSAAKAASKGNMSSHALHTTASGLHNEAAQGL